MPAGNISATERMKRIYEIKELTEAGMSPAQVSNELGMSLEAVKRNIKYLRELETSLLDPELVMAKRVELDNALLEAVEEARNMFFELKGKGDIKLARSFHQRWTETLMNRAKLYGLDTIKVENITQVNTQNNVFTEDVKLDKKTLDKIINSIVGSHE